MASENLRMVNRFLADVKDKDGNEGRWVTMRGTHVFIRSGETPAQALKRSIIGKAHERGKTPIKPKAKEEKKVKGLSYEEKTKLEKQKHQQRQELESQKHEQRKELQTRKEIERQARAQGKTQEREQIKYERKSKKEEGQVQKFIEKTGFDRETAERQLFGKSQGDEKQTKITERQEKLREMSKGKTFGKIVGTILDTVAKFMKAATTGEVGVLMQSLIDQYEQIYKDQKIASKEKKKVLKEIEGLYEDIDQYREFYQLDALGEDIIVGDYPVAAYERESGPVKAHTRGEGTLEKIQEAAKKRFKVTVQKWNPKTKQWINLELPEDEQGSESAGSSRHLATKHVDTFLKRHKDIQVRAFVKEGTKKGFKIGPFTNVGAQVIGKRWVTNPKTKERKYIDKTKADEMRSERAKWEYNIQRTRGILYDRVDKKRLANLMRLFMGGKINEKQMKELRTWEKKLNLDLSAIVPPHRIPTKIPSSFSSNFGDVPIAIRMIIPKGVHGQEPKGGYGAIFYENPVYSYMDPKNKKGKFLSGGDEIYREKLNQDELVFFIDRWSRNKKKVKPIARYRSYRQRLERGKAEGLYGNYFGYDTIRLIEDTLERTTILVHDFRGDLSVSDVIKDCVGVQLESGKTLNEAYAFCGAQQDFIRQTPEEYLHARGDAISAGLSQKPAPLIGGPTVRAMRTIAEAVKMAGSPSGAATKSSHITKVGYFNSQLELEFKNKSRYVYFVGPEFYKGFVESKSKGKYLWEKLRGKRPGLVFDNPNKITAGGVPFPGGKGGIVPYAKGSGGTPDAKTLRPSEPEVPSERGSTYKEVQLEWFKKGLSFKETGLPKRDFTMGGFITRSGEFDYGPEGVKVKNWDNLKKIFNETKHAPIFGTRSYGAHGESYNRLIGYTYDWEFFEPGEIDKDGHIFAKNELFEDIANLSDLKDPSELPVSIGFIDLGIGDIQNISKLRHLAVSLNKLEEDRCSTMGGIGCNISIIKSGIRDTDDFRNDEAYPQIIKNYKQKVKKMGEEYDDLMKEEVEKILAEEDIYEFGEAESHNTSNAQAVFMRRCESNAHSKEACDMAWKAKEGGGAEAVKSGTQDPSKFNSRGDIDENKDKDIEEIVEISIKEYADLLGSAKVLKSKMSFIEKLENREADRISKEKKEITDFLIARKVPEATIKKATKLCDLIMLKEGVESQIVEEDVDDFEVQQVNNQRLMDRLGSKTISADFAKLEEEARLEALEDFFPTKK